MGTILAVDDEGHILDLIVRILEGLGHLTLSGTTVEQALGVLELTRVDLVVLNIELPGVRGSSALEAIRSFWPDTMIVCTTANGSVRGAVAALQAGAFDYVEKPFDIGELRTIVDRALEAGSTRHGSGAAFPNFQDPPHEASRPSDPIYRDLEPTGAVLGRIASLAFATEPRPSSLDHAESSDSWPRQMVTALAQALMGSVNQTPPVFWALARGFRFMSSEPPRGPREFAEGLHRVVKKSAESSSRTRPRTRAIAKTLEDRMASTGGRLRLHELASELRVNRHYLSRLLKVDTGMTFRQWRWAVLMRAAVGQLGSSDKDIRQIASAAGYEDPRQFDRGFRRLFGTSPREFRRLARNDALLKN